MRYIFLCFSKEIYVVGTHQALLMNTPNICFLQEISKMSIFSQVILVGQVDFYHLLVPGQVIKFDNSTTLHSRFVLIC